MPAQYQNPSSIKWMQIKTSHFRVVFPEDIRSKGYETACLLERAYTPVSRSLQCSPRNTAVFLFNQSVISNGYTSLAPRHMGFYTTPPQNAGMYGGIDWLQILTIHEYRHMVQFTDLDQNLTTFVGSLFGDYGKLFCMGISIPFWVLEGDAVCSETVFSEEGRGRLASFTRDIRALELENTRFSYSKAYLGSYRQYFPDHYHLGYLLTAYIRKNYGTEVWNESIEHTTRFPLYPFMFSRGLKKHTHYNLEKIYHGCLNEFDSIWSANTSSEPTTDFFKISPGIQRGFTNYSYPFPIDANRILALKSGFDDAPTLVIIEGGKETKLIEIRPVDRIHSNGKLVTWASRTTDIRWGQRDYSDILLYDLTTGELRYLTWRGKYFAPSISPDGRQLAAIEYGSDMNCSLVILDTKSGRELSRYTFPPDAFARMPAWSADGTKLVMTITSGSKRTVSLFNIASGEWSEIIPPTTESITNPAFYNDYILFGSPVAGTDAIYAIHSGSKERYLVLQSRYGVYNAVLSAEDSSFLFQNYTTCGYEIDGQKINTRAWKDFTTLEIKKDNYVKQLVNQEEGGNIFESVNTVNFSEYKEKKFHSLLHSVKIHSWAPYPIVNGVGFSVFSNDVLNTTMLEAGVNYFPKDYAHREYIKLRYSKYFPIFDMGLSYGRNYNAEQDSSDRYTFRKVNEKVMHFDIILPLDFSQHIYTTTLEPEIGLKYIFAEFPDADSTESQKYDVLALAFQFNFARIKQQTYRDIHPKFAQVFTFSLWNSPFEQDLQGSRLLFNGKLYFPGLWKHHSLILSAGFEKNTHLFREGIYKLTSDLEPVRGYGRIVSDQTRKGMIEYTMPLFYPDVALGPILYIKRVSANLFSDNAIIYLEDNSDFYNSVGIDLNFEVNWFKIIIPFEMGMRYSYTLQDHDHHFEFLFFGVNF
jgi:hypothetical protein